MHYEDLTTTQICWWQEIPTVMRRTAIVQRLVYGTPTCLIRQAIGRGMRGVTSALPSGMSWPVRIFPETGGLQQWGRAVEVPMRHGKLVGHQFSSSGPDNAIAGKSSEAPDVDQDDAAVLKGLSHAEPV